MYAFTVRYAELAQSPVRSQATEQMQQSRVYALTVHRVYCPLRIASTHQSHVESPSTERGHVRQQVSYLTSIATNRNTTRTTKAVVVTRLGFVDCLGLLVVSRASMHDEWLGGTRKTRDRGRAEVVNKAEKGFDEREDVLRCVRFSE